MKVIGAADGTSPPSVAPIASEERIALLDVLRGFALFGIFVINLGGLSLYVFLTPEQKAAIPTAYFDGAVNFVRHFLFEGKFYSLFSLLFGIGFAVQLIRAGQRPGRFLPLFRRRLLVLLGIGAIHMTLLWDGDILFLYALTGFFLIPFRGREDRTLLVWAAALLVLPILLQIFVAASAGALDPGAPIKTLARQMDAHFGYSDKTPWGTVLSGGGWREYFAFVLPGPFYRLADLLSSHRLPKVLAMFLVGYFVGRRMHAGGLEPHRDLLRRVLVWGLAVGIPANMVMTYFTLRELAWKPTGTGVLHAVTYSLGVAPMALAYAAGLALLYMMPGWKTRLDVLGPVGRMALTNYLMQTVVGITLFYGIGFGLGGRVGPTLFFPVALAVFALQVAGSHWWLARYRFGPVEWVWRSLTYGARQPMLRPRAVPLAPLGQEA